MATWAADRSVIRGLADRYTEIAALPLQKENAAQWTRLNALQKGRPLVFVNQVPWEEISFDDELALRCTDEFCRGIEWQFRVILYQWEHFRGDIVLSDKWYSPLVIHDTGFGYAPKGRRGSDMSYEPQITSEADVEKIAFPEVILDEAASAENLEKLKELFGDILPVEAKGVGYQWFAPWDYLIRIWGVQQAMEDLVLKPDLVHAGIDRLVDAYIHRLNQYESLNILSLTNDEMQIGSGGAGFTDELPKPGFVAHQIRTTDQWGSSTSQIFSEVSPSMHQEFALRYEQKWLDRFGLAYYGCCEPLHHKVDMLKSIKNLRKISMNYRADIEAGAASIEDRYVFSYKPNPAFLATDRWSPEVVRSEMRDVLEKTRGCVVEIILKDITTVASEPRRLSEWHDVVMETVWEFA